jgi:hypothetical protein
MLDEGLDSVYSVSLEATPTHRAGDSPDNISLTGPQFIKLCGLLRVLLPPALFALTATNSPKRRLVPMLTPVVLKLLI